MKSPRSFGLIRLGCLALGLSALTLSARAQVLLEDEFGGSGVVNGRTPDTADAGGATWVDTSIGDPYINPNPNSNTISGGVDNYSLNDAYPIALAYAASNFVDGQTYTLSTDFTYTSGSGWIGIGFLDGTPSTTYNSGYSAFNNGVAWMINNGEGNGVNGFANTAGTGPFNSSVGNTTAGLNSGIMEIQLSIIDPAGDGTATFLLGPNASDLTTIGTLSLGYAEVQTITGVGFYGYGYNNGVSTPGGTIDNFTLAAAATPEPGSGALMLFGLGALMMGYRLTALRRA